MQQVSRLIGKAPAFALALGALIAIGELALIGLLSTYQFQLQRLQDDQKHLTNQIAEAFRVCKQLQR